MNVCDMTDDLFTMDACKWWIYQFDKEFLQKYYVTDKRIDCFVQRLIRNN